MRRRVITMTGLLLLCPSIILATAFYVDETNGACSDADGNNGQNPAVPWCTIARATNASKTSYTGDDVINIVAGSYDETLTPPDNGTSGHPITFIGSSGSPPACGGTFTGAAAIRDINLNAKEWITIQGLEITNTGMSASSNASIISTAGEGLVIVNNYIHDTTSIGIGDTNLSSFAGPQTEQIRIANNTICKTGPSTAPPAGRATAIRLWSKWTLVENNTFGANQDAVQINGSYGMVRNNTFNAPEPGGNDHLDAFQVNACISAGGALLEGWNYVLFEGNLQRNYENSNQDHSWVVNGVDECTSGGWSHGIFRYNTIHDIGSAVGLLDGSGQYAAVYNNTVVDANTLATQAAVIGSAATSNGSGTLTTVILNNIFVNAIDEVAGEARLYDFRSGDATSRGNGNLARLDADPTQAWDAPYTSEATFNTLKNQDPDFVSSTDFRLQVGSPAINAGVSLTLANGTGSSSTSLTVDDVQFFQDGWSMIANFGVQADCIAVGTVTNTACISSIDYAKNVITLASALTWSDNADVWLYKKSDGTIVLKGSAPDLGANETDPTSSRRGNLLLMMQPKPFNN